MLKRLFYIVFVITPLQLSEAQENNFSQFYISPQYINPAFAGDASYIKAGLATRLMQPLTGTYIINSLLHIDYKLLNHHSGIGMTFFQHTEELTHSKLQLNYSYTIRLSNNAWAKAGLGLSFNQRYTRSKAFTYPDQYNNYGYVGNATTEPSLHERSFFPGVSAGAIIYNEILWLSLSGDYLNMPTENFAGQNTVYPMKISFMAGMLYPLNKTTSKRRFSKFGGLEPYSCIGPVISITSQNKYVEASGGIVLHIKPIFVGMHYRYQHDFINPDNTAYKALVFMAGYRQEEVSVTYSYDFSLSQYSINRSGAHEIAIILYFSSPKHDLKRQDLVPLPNQLMY
jgi:type IX secretion system PorP/SprF family membrane protein